MSLDVPDDILKAAGLTERDALLEFACRLFQAGKLTLGQAVRLAQTSRTDFEHQCHKRGIAVYEPTPEDFAEDLRAIDKLHGR